MGASWHRALASVNPLFRTPFAPNKRAGVVLAVRKPVPSISGANLFAGLVFSSIGFVGFLFGKKLHLWKPMFIGIALMAYPYFIEDTLTLCAIGVAGTAALFWARN